MGSSLAGPSRPLSEERSDERCTERVKGVEVTKRAHPPWSLSEERSDETKRRDRRYSASASRTRNT
jgi:hypothetical protein